MITTVNAFNTVNFYLNLNDLVERLLFKFERGSSFFMGLKQLKHQNKTEILDLVITTPDANIEMTMGDYQQVMYPNAEDAGYVAVATKKLGVWSQRMQLATDWFNHVDLTTNCYLSVNTYFRPLRQTRAVRHLNAFFLDLDIYNAGVSEQDVFNAIDFLVRTERMLPPTMVLSSGRGMYIIIKIEDVPGAYKRVRVLYEAIQQYLFELFEDCGADANAKDVARVLRVPASTNTKSGKKVEVLYYNPEAIYTMSMWAPFVDVFENKQKVNKAKKSSLKGRVQYLLNGYTLHKARSEDIETICYLRDYKLSGLRDTIMYIYHYYMMQIHHDEQVALYYTLNLNDLFSEPLTEKEVKSYVKSSINAYYEHQKDRRKGYNFKNETLIERLAITPHEMAQLKTIITLEEKYDRNNKRRTPRNEDGLTKRQQDKQYLVERVKEMKARGYKQREMAEILEITKGTVSKYLKL